MNSGHIDLELIISCRYLETYVRTPSYKHVNEWQKEIA